MYHKDSAEWVWLAGYLSGRGGFGVVRSRGKYAYLRYTMRAPQGDDAIAHAASVMGASVMTEESKRNGNVSHLVMMQGEPLIEVIRNCWPWLSLNRRAQFKLAMARVIDDSAYVPKSLVDWMTPGPEDHVKAIIGRRGEEARAAGRARWRAQRKAEAEEKARAERIAEESTREKYVEALAPTRKNGIVVWNRH